MNFITTLFRNCLDCYPKKELGNVMICKAKRILTKYRKLGFGTPPGPNHIFGQTLILCIIIFIKLGNDQGSLYFHGYSEKKMMDQN